MNASLFAYIYTADDCIFAEIYSHEDRDALIAMKGDRKAIYQWLSDNVDGDELPDFAKITSVDVELDDNAADALAGGNETVEVWAV